MRNCAYCQAAGLLPTYYNPRERRCAFPNEGNFVSGGGWGCPVEDALCELIRDKNRITERYYLGQDAHGSLVKLWELYGEDATPEAIWATWYKSRGYFEQLVALGWSEESGTRPLRFAEAVELIQMSSKRTFYDDILRLSPEQARAQAGEAGTATTTEIGVVHEHAVRKADAPK